MFIFLQLTTVQLFHKMYFVEIYFDPPIMLSESGT